MAKLNKIRTPLFLLIGVFLMLLMIIVEMGGSFRASTSVFDGVGDRFKEMKDAIGRMGKGGADKTNSEVSGFKDLEKLLNQDSEDPPGYGIASLMYVDVLLLFTYIMMALPMAIKPKIVAQTQGLITIIVCIITIILAFFFILKVLVLLFLMIALLLAIPFGTIIYMIRFGFFDTSEAAAIMATLMVIKILGAICLPVAHEKFLKNFGVILLIGTSLITMIILSFLHNFLPFFLVSITDCLGALLIAIIAIIWSIILLISGIISLIKVIKGLENIAK